ncbi:hypothetical protein I4U23_005768 [Adineta vaga]|nr:hypothetical protein I4U23_005768 [Adineta vaga]
MNRIERLTTNQTHSELFQCSNCTGKTSILENEICDFCWYDFEATEDERQIVNKSNEFRELSVHQWFEKFQVIKVSSRLFSSISIMHILHDYFRSSSKKIESCDCLRVAMTIFPDGVHWLRRLLGGFLTIDKKPTSNERIYKFHSTHGRTPIWYKITKNEIDSKIKWSWTPYNPLKTKDNSIWISCPQLLVSHGIYENEIPISDHVFIIMFLHIYRPNLRFNDWDNQSIEDYKLYI